MSQQSAAHNDLFDPDAAVVTTERLQTVRLSDGKKMLNQYVMDAKVGKGQHGNVWRCHDHLNQSRVLAMKIVKRDNPKARRERQYKQLRQQNLPRSDHVPVVDGIRTAEQEIRKEIAIMKKCRHPHVVRLYEVIDDRKNDQIFMVMEYLGGGEIKYTNENRQPILTVEQTRRIMRDAILGLEYLHHQGIIHRDIKPANLIWTSDHDRVKIADFGTAHFSYAQRLASAGNDAKNDDPEDPILLNEADLAKRAGSPAFLAPEIVWEYKEFPEGETPPPRPPVTKAIDIWALGVTLYCLLFGKTPFRPPGQYQLSEWTGYHCVCNSDWRAPSTMGYDQVPTGGRIPEDETTEGGVVMHLLDHFLKKDSEVRITLDEVKMNPWFLHDLPNPDTWLEMTSPRPIVVSAKETSDAMSTLRFRWNWGSQFSRRISTFLRTAVRPQRSRDAIPGEDGSRGPVKSDPNVRLSEHKGKHKGSDERERGGRHGHGPSHKRASSTAPSNSAKKMIDTRSRSTDVLIPGGGSGGGESKVGSGSGSGSGSVSSWSPTIPPYKLNRQSQQQQLTSSSPIDTRSITSSRPSTPSSTRRMSKRPPISPTLSSTATTATSTATVTSSTGGRMKLTGIFSSITHWRPNRFSSPSTPALTEGAATSTMMTDVSSPVSVEDDTSLARAVHRRTLQRCMGDSGSGGGGGSGIGMGRSGSSGAVTARPVASTTPLNVTGSMRCARASAEALRYPRFLRDEDQHLLIPTSPHTSAALSAAAVAAAAAGGNVSLRDGGMSVTGLLADALGRRTSSWDHPKEFEDITSLNSDGDLDEQVMTVGAGGVGHPGELEAQQEEAWTRRRERAAARDGASASASVNVSASSGSGSGSGYGRGRAFSVGDDDSMFDTSNEDDYTEEGLGAGLGQEHPYLRAGYYDKQHRGDDSTEGHDHDDEDDDEDEGLTFSAGKGKKNKE